MAVQGIPVLPFAQSYRGDRSQNGGMENILPMLLALLQMQQQESQFSREAKTHEEESKSRIATEALQREFMKLQTQEAQEAGITRRVGGEREGILSSKQAEFGASQNQFANSLYDQMEMGARKFRSMFPSVSKEGRTPRNITTSTRDSLLGDLNHLQEKFTEELGKIKDVPEKVGFVTEFTTTMDRLAVRPGFSADLGLSQKMEDLRSASAAIEPTFSRPRPEDKKVLVDMILGARANQFQQDTTRQMARAQAESRDLESVYPEGGPVLERGKSTIYRQFLGNQPLPPLEVNLPLLSMGQEMLPVPERQPQSLPTVIEDFFSSLGRRAQEFSTGAPYEPVPQTQGGMPGPFGSDFGWLMSGNMPKAPMGAKVQHVDPAQPVGQGRPEPDFLNQLLWSGPGTPYSSTYGPPISAMNRDAFLSLIP